MAERLRHARVEIGDALPPLVCPPVTRLMLALYCGASGDHNPLHVDIDFAHDAGLDDVIAQGMLVMAWMGRALTAQVPQAAIREFGTRFHAMTRVGDALVCHATIVEKMSGDGEPRVRVAIEARDQRGELKATGDALIALPA